MSSLRNDIWAIEIGHALEDVRVAARLTQQELADALKEYEPGLRATKATISNIERGYSGATDLDRLGAIAAVCAGRGWLPDDSDDIARYLVGRDTELPLIMRRRAAQIEEKSAKPAAAFIRDRDDVALVDLHDMNDEDREEAPEGASSGTTSDRSPGRKPQMSYSMDSYSRRRRLGVTAWLIPPDSAARELPPGRHKALARSRNL